MLQTNLNNFFIITSVVVGLFAILLIWVYLWETSRGLKITEIQIYKNYVNCSFAFALVMLEQELCTQNFFFHSLS